MGHIFNDLKVLNKKSWVLNKWQNVFIIIIIISKMNEKGVIEYSSHENVFNKCYRK